MASTNTGGGRSTSGRAVTCAVPARWARSSARSAGNVSGPSAGRRSAARTGAVKPSERPTPRSIRPGKSDSSIANCSATTIGWWLGSITPPEPTRIRAVRAATTAISTAGLPLAMPGTAWCSATQNRW
ncbi:hypothetical protein BJF78_27255 [Pseudonocardia sp. CNS-139]|nr:hypothetical protein BJF78_27255 [Pseudonocardia sp. CNS-139]